MENSSIQRVRGLNPGAVQGDEAPTKQIEDAEQVAQTLRDKITALQAKLEEAEGIIRKQDSEIKNLTANVDVLVGQIRKLTQSSNPPQPESVTKTGDAEQLTESPNAKIANLEARITEIQQTLLVGNLPLKRWEKASLSKSSIWILSSKTRRGCYSIEIKK